MEHYEIGTYGERIADVYDLYYPECAPGTVATLKSLARTGRALELGIGTGRAALPLAQAGVPVEGIDASKEMVARLRSKPGGGSIPVVIGDFADVAVEGRFNLVYVLFNTFFALQSQAEQVRCFVAVAQHLDAGGAFVVEAFVPDLGRFRGGQDLRTVSMGDGEVRIDASLLDPVAQLVTGHHVVLSGRGIRLYPVRLRYAWPGELDLMARLAGLSLQHRWGGWDQGPFTEASKSHISVYG